MFYDKYQSEILLFNQFEGKLSMMARGKRGQGEFGVVREKCRNLAVRVEPPNY
jgi:hypothetical protein